MRNLLQKPVITLIFAAALGWNPLPAFAEDLPESAREGIAYYNEEQFDQAARKFSEAEALDPENPTVRYNAGNAKYRLGRYEAAIEDYGKVLSGDTPPALRQKTWYNQGNAWFRLGALDRAMDSYKKALELNPKDEDSKFNYEFAKRQLEQAIASGQMMPRNMDKGKPQPGKKQKQAPHEASQSESTEPAGHGEANEQPEPAEETRTAEQEPEKNKKKEEPQEQMADETPPAPSSPEQKKMNAMLKEAAPLTQEEAERLLGSLSEDLKKFKRRQLQGEMQDLFKDQGKDW